MTVPGLPDAADRVRVRVSAASLAVEASAGTGKTFLLVERALWLILVRRVKPEALVALAFGEEAAAELKARLRAKLERIVRAPGRDALDPEVLAMAPAEPLAALQALAASALEGLDRAHLSTIHAFASALIRLFPAESGVDPAFEVVEEAGFSEIVRDEWSRFVAAELGGPEGPPPGETAGARRGKWLAVLARVRMADLFDLGAALADYECDLEALPAESAMSDASRRWLAGLAKAASAVLREVPPSRKKATAALGDFAAVLDEAARDGHRVLAAKHGAISAAAALGRSDIPREVSAAALAAFREVSAAARVLRAVRDEALVFEAVELLLPFARRARARLLEEGRLPYSGLLSLARDLVRDNHAVRRGLARRFDAILVDEAQDVDPVQLELILYLAADPGCAAANWRDLVLSPGKLFVVGDPKQSIYGFRGADVGAFSAVLDLMTGQGAERIAPTTSMRSAPEVLSAVNAVGSRVFPRYRPLQSFPGRAMPAVGMPAPAAGMPGPAAGMPGPAAEVLVVEPGAAGGASAEASAVADRALGLLRAGLDPADIAILFRKRGPMPEFQAALRRLAIPSTIEAERRFFLRPEIHDLVNVVRLIADPGDGVALLGVLRGPYGGLDDAAVNGLLAGGRPGDGPLAGTLAKLRRDLAILPAHEWAEDLFRDLGVEAVAAASGDSSARGAVRAFRRMLADALEEHGLPRTLELLEESMRAEADTRGAGRAPLAPPAAGGRAEGAVRLLTVHGAKGLEFPAVILADIDARPQGAKSTDTAVLRDWTGGTHGITLRAIRSEDAAATLDGCRLKAQRAMADREETGRLVYVALTRAREILIVADREVSRGGRRPGGDTFRSFLGPLLTFPDSPATRRTPAVPPFPAAPAAGAAAGRGAEARAIPAPRPAVPAAPTLVTPSSLDERPAPEDDGSPGMPPGTRGARAWLGELCHEILRGWDFRTPAGSIDAALAAAVEAARARVGGSREVPAALLAEARAILGAFLRSDSAARLRRAEILGREVPLVAHVDGRTVSARADVVFAADGALRIGDFKLSSGSLPSAEVARTYVAAGSAAYGRACKFEILPLEGDNGGEEDTFGG